MKLTLVVLAALVAVVASVCHSDADCGIDNSPCNHGEHYKCVHSKCACTKVKRQGHDHCKVASDCTCGHHEIAACTDHQCSCSDKVGKRAAGDVCHTKDDCTCDANSVASCVNSHCFCNHHGKRAAPAKCASDADCTCDHNSVPSCVDHHCYCNHHGRREQIHCMTDDDCVNYNCASHPGDMPYCLHHGDPAHGHNLCACK